MEWLVLAVLALIFFLLIRELFHPSIAFGGGLFLFYLLDLISTEALLQNFANTALVTLMLLLLYSQVLERTVFMDLAATLFTGQGKRKPLGILVTVTTLASAFLNNTAVVATFMGAVRRNAAHPSRLLIPLSYAAIAGGTITLVGTSTNLIVSGFAQNAGLPPLEMFQFAAVGVPAALAVILVLLLFSPRLLPARGEVSEEDVKAYFLEARVVEGSPLAGKSVAANGLRKMKSLFLAEIVREGRLISPVAPDEPVLAGDLLIFTGEVGDIQSLERFKGLQVVDGDYDIAKDNLVEVVVSHESSLVGKEVKDANFRSKFDAAVVAVRRGDSPLSGKIGKIVLEPGDALILITGNDFRKRNNLRNNFYIVSGVETERKLSTGESVAALGGFLVVLLGSSMGVWPLIKGVMVLLGVALFRGWLDFSRIRSGISLGLFLAIGSALGIAGVMQESGAADLLARGLGFLLPQGSPFGMLVGVYLVTLLFTELVTNAAAAALAFPLALGVANGLGLDPTPFVMAVAFGASASFLTPHGYQTNLMVYGVGKYGYKDYLKMGTPVTLAYSAVVLAVLPLAFPFVGEG